MSDATGRELSEAYELIEAERLDEARTVLKPLLEADKDNPDVWWLYAHAVSDVEGARLALNQVLQLDPNYPEARDLLNSLESKAPIADSFDDDFDPSFLPDDMPSTLPGLFDDDDDMPDDGDFDDDDFEDEDEDEESERKSLLQQPALLAAIVLFVVVAVVAIALALLNPSPSTPPTATSVAADSTFTPLPIDTAAPIATTDGSSQTTEGDYDALLLAINGVAEAESVRVTQTSLGDTLLVTLCSADRREARNLLPQVMNELAQQSSTITDPVSAIGAEIVNCDDRTPLLVIAAPVEDAIVFADNGLTDSEFEASWRPVG